MTDDKVVFDNWRVLHGRSAFTGKRRICGGYSEFPSTNRRNHVTDVSPVNHDDFISRWRNTNFSRKEVLQQIL